MNHPNSIEAFWLPRHRLFNSRPSEKKKKPKTAGYRFMFLFLFSPESEDRRRSVACLGNSFLRLWPRPTEKMDSRAKQNYISGKTKTVVNLPACHAVVVPRGNRATRWWRLASVKTPCSAIRKPRGLLSGFSRTDSLTFIRVDIFSKASISSKLLFSSWICAKKFSA